MNGRTFKRHGFALLESLWLDVRYAVRTLRRTPLFAVTVAATMGLGLGLLGSAFTILNAYLLKPIDLPNPHALYALSWDTETTRRQRFRLTDYEALQPEARRFAGLAAAQDVTVMQDSVSTRGLLVTGTAGLVHLAIMPMDRVILVHELIGDLALGAAVDEEAAGDACSTNQLGRSRSGSGTPMIAR